MIDSLMGEADQLEVDSSPDALFQDETRLTRRQVLDRYFTPKLDVDHLLNPDLLFSADGFGEIAVIRPRSAFVMPQIRDTYDANHIDKIGTNICNSDAGQLQNGGVALISEEHIMQYLEDLNEFFDSKVLLDEIAWHEDFGGYLITVFGHNRQLGIASVNLRQNGHPDLGTPFYAKLMRDPPFWQVLEMQAVENTGLAPKMWDRSRAIVNYKKLRTRDGIPPTQSEIADKFGVDADQVWRAERYEALPDKIKKLVVEEKLPYSGSFELDRLFAYYDEDDVVKLAQRLAERKASSEQINDEVKKRLIVVELTPEIYVLNEEGKITLPQARELHRLRKAGASDQKINELAQWICLAEPKLKIAEIRQRVDEDVAHIIRGDRSIFDQDDGRSLEEIEEEQTVARQEQAAALLSKSVTGVHASLRGILTAMESGVVTQEAVSGLPLSTAVDGEMADIFQRVASGEIDGIDPELVKLMLETIEYEAQLANGIDNRAQLRKAAARVLSAAQANVSPQESMLF